MSDYSQPDFYRFNEDSILFVKWISEQIVKAERLLDLGAGCGVIGLELKTKIPISHITFLEVQSDFIPYLIANSKDHNSLISQSQFSNFFPERKFDLIVCNPPYYLQGHGQGYSDSRRMIARSFVIDNWSELLGCIERSLAEDGRCFIVIKDDKRILAEIRMNLPGHLSLEVFSPHPGLCFLRLHKN